MIAASLVRVPRTTRSRRSVVFLVALRKRESCPDAVRALSCARRGELCVWGWRGACLPAGKGEAQAKGGIIRAPQPRGVPSETTLGRVAQSSVIMRRPEETVMCMSTARGRVPAAAQQQRYWRLQVEGSVFRLPRRAGWDPAALPRPPRAGKTAVPGCIPSCCGRGSSASAVDRPADLPTNSLGFPVWASFTRKPSLCIVSDNTVEPCVHRWKRLLFPLVFSWAVELLKPWD